MTGSGGAARPSVTALPSQTIAVRDRVTDRVRRALIRGEHNFLRRRRGWLHRAAAYSCSMALAFWVTWTLLLRSAPLSNRVLDRARRRSIACNAARDSGARPWEAGLAVRGKKSPTNRELGDAAGPDDPGFPARMQAARRTRVAVQPNAAGGSCVTGMPNWCRPRAAKATP